MNVGKNRLAKIQLVDALLDEIFTVGGVADCKIAREFAGDFNLAAQEAGAEGVKSTQDDVSRRRTDKLFGAGLHFVSRLVREGYCQNIPRRYTLRNHVGDSAGQHASFT